MIERLLAELSYKWWQLTHPRAVIMEKLRLRREHRAARARFEAFKKARGIK